MAVLYETIDLRGTEPLCLCLDHYKEWKIDPKSATRLKEEKNKMTEKLRASRSPTDRPRSPEGWQLDAEDLVHELNQTVENLRFDVPYLIGLQNKDCLDKLKSLGRIKEMFHGIEDEAKIAFCLRGMKRPEGVAFNPDTGDQRSDDGQDQRLT